MNRRIFPTLLLLGGITFAQSTESDDQVAARKGALEIAGAFSNDGFKLRDGHWAGAIKPGEVKIVQVNLYAGNEYYFSVAGAEKAKKMTLTAYDETGVEIQIEDPYQQGAAAAIGFSPDFSGPYYIKVEEVEGDATGYCLVCSYK